MIDIVIYKKNDNYIGFESSGHADYSSGEFDIVCAGVSTITQTFYFYLIEDLDIDSSCILAKQKNGFLKIEYESDDLRVQDGYKYLIRGLKLLEESYSEYIKLQVMEVQDDKI